ncbi:MAG: energy transducer TonB [Lacunisphaera sp.]
MKQIAIPVLPSRYGTPDKKPVRALVSFYVDEQGKVRLPNVESALVPELVVAAVNALQQWAFKPPLTQGQPVLVHAMRVLTFRPESAAKPAK